MKSLVEIASVFFLWTFVTSMNLEKRGLTLSPGSQLLCNIKCYIKFPLICASNGKTYRGICEMLRDRCRLWPQKIRFVKFGKCPTCKEKETVRCVVPACFLPSCPAYPKAVCVSFCPCQAEYYYQSRKVNCNPRPPTNPCASKICGSGSICKVVKGRAVCVSKGSVCSLRKLVGPCRARFLRFYYNSRTQKCERFYYGGCRGNRNNYQSKERCEATCKSNDACSLPAVQGPCEAHIERYFFNVTTSRCERFYYGGCRGNKNNFKTKKECETQCERSGSPCDVVFCGVGGKCEVVNGKAICKSPEDVCTLPKVVGPCRARIPRYYYNSKTGRCEGFSYGGCGGNKNNFRSLAECRRATAKCTPRGDVCTLPKVVGPCKGNILRYYYNSKTGRCGKFFYGGCGGNKNNFRSLAECRRATAKCTPRGDVCTLPKVVGLCKARILRYYYNSKTGRCEGFSYGGCGGNKNNFRSLAECRRATAKCTPRALCANISCNASQECKVILGRPVCRQILINPCIATLCLVGTRCVVINGEGKCVPVKPLPSVSPSCAATSCVKGKRCVVKDGKAICATPCLTDRDCKQQGSICDPKLRVCDCKEICFTLYKPVCGSDGEKYGNRCELDAAACEKRTNITAVACPGN